MTAVRDIGELRLELASRAHSLPDEDVRLLAAIAAELPSAELAARLEAETAKGVDRAGKAATVLPTPRHARLLTTLDDWRLVLGLPARKRRSVGAYLRSEP